MKEVNQENFYIELAKRYNEIVGQELINEAAKAEGDTKQDWHALDLKVKSKLKGTRSSHPKYWLMAAAALLIMLLIPLSLYWQSNNYIETNTTPKDVAEASMEDQLQLLSTRLPEELRIEEVKIDQGQSIYKLKNRNSDDIVLTLQETEPQINPDSFVDYELDGKTVSLRYVPDYSLMQFEHQGIWYQLSCKYSPDSLVPLAQALLL